MQPETWIEVKQILADAIELPADRRDALLDVRCDGRPDLRREVEALLTAHAEADAFLDSPVEASASEESRSLTGRQFGPFRLGPQLGSGGMGVVYEADRVEGGYEQQAAIKIITLPADDPEALARFRLERQILATLHHPNVVTLIDGGVSPDGDAFLVMERVDGVRITDYCSERQLPLPERLRLFEAVCAAVQHAHQHGVVHRDLKPANILVTADGTPKVLDFGVAKIVAPTERDVTATGLLGPMTPDYASPEQLRGLPVTTAADIYALGVMLYEIVSGQRPYSTKGLTLDRVLDVVVNDEPSRPSTAARRTPATTPYPATALRGDLDAIVRKAMHKTATARYGSAQELADDLARWRASKPVLAREPSFGYLVRRTIRRHRAAAVATLVAIVAMVGGLGVALWQMRVAADERDRAQARFNDTRQIASALIFKVHDGLVPLPGSTPIRKMIVAEALTYLERLSRDPAGDDGLRRELATAYQRIGDVQGHPGGANLGDREGARDSYRRAVALLEPLASRPGAPPAIAGQLAGIELELASTERALGHADAAMTLIASGVTRARALVSAAPADIDARSLLARAYFAQASNSDPKDALPHWNEAAALYGGLLAERPEDPERQRNVALVEKYLGANYQLRRDLDRAVEHYQRAHALDEKRLQARPGDRTVMFDVAIDLSNIAGIDQLAGRLDAAAAGYERSLVMRSQLYALDPNDVQIASRVAFAHNRLTNLYVQLKRYPDALAHARKGVEVTGKIATVDADDAYSYASHLMTLGEVEGLVGNRAGACRAFRRSAEVAADLQARPSTDAGVKTQVVQLQKGVGVKLGTCGGR
jgi:tetratricopeptide (TPR) repeat protein